MPSAPPPLPAMVGRYRLESFLAKGGMGAVHVAVDEGSGTRVALKRLRDRAADKPRVVALFEREYHTLVGLEHPNIVRVLDYGVDADGPYYTMELIEGQDLSDSGAVAVEDACRYLRDVASALALLHARRLVHRDLSPRNVRIDRAGNCRLIDFGALATFGVADDVVGTPPMIPPESMRGDPIDQRADLYSLGALAYRILTGKHAYPANKLDDLQDAWTRRPPPPSTHDPSIPAALDELVMSLLSPDPAARPSSAAEVIDHLSRVARLPPSDARGEAVSYLRVPALIGREGTSSTLEAHLTAGVHGRGSAVRLVGERGVGRSRLLGEVAVGAQIKGAAVVRVDAGLHPEPFGLARAVVLRLLDALGAPGLEAARTHAPSIVQLEPSLRERLGPLEGAVTEPGSGEWRAVVQAALMELTAAFSRIRPLVLLVDDVHSADAGSAAWLASLAYGSEPLALVIVGAVRSAEAMQAPEAMRLFEQWSVALPVEPLGLYATMELARRLFGDVPNVSRMGERLHGVTGGNPGHVVELARHFAEVGIVRYEDGAWVLPRELDAHDIPSALTDLVAWRLSRLGPEALDLCEALSLHRPVVPVEQALDLIEDASRARRHEILDELARAGVLVSQGASLRFAQGLLRAAVAQRVSEERARSLHLRIARSLLAAGGLDPATRVEAGRHLLEGGERLRGATLMAGAISSARSMFELNDDLPTVVPVAETALAVYQEHGRSDYEMAPLYGLLARASYYVDFRLGAKHGKDAVVLLRRLTGTALMERLRPFMGARLAMIVGLLVARVRFAVAPKRERLYPFEELVVHLLGAVTTLSGVSVLCANQHAVRRLIDAIAPLGAFGPRTTPSGIRTYLEGAILFLQERFAETRAVYEDLIARFEDPKQFPTLPAAARKAYIGGCLYTLAVADAMEGRATALERADRLEALGSATYRMVVEQVRLLYSAMTGDAARLRYHQERIEVRAVQLGSSWQVDVWAPSTMVPFYEITGDVMGMKRCARELGELVEEIPTLRLYERGARACYHELRGELDVSLPLSEEVLRDAQPGVHLGWAGIPTLTAKQLVRAGQPARALELCLAAQDAYRRFERPFDALEANNVATLAEALVALGRASEAAERLDACLEAHGGSAAPLSMTVLAIARTRVASAQGDDHAYLRHLAEAKRWARRCHHPSLLASVRRLAELGVHTSMTAVGPPTLRPSSTSSGLDDEGAGSGTTGRSREEAAARALSVLHRRTGALSGFFFDRRGHALELVAWVGDPEPSDTLMRELVAWTEDEGPRIREELARSPHALEVSFAMIDRSSDTEDAVTELRIAFWELHPEARVRAVASLRGARPLTAPSSVLLRSVAERLDLEDRSEPEAG